MKLSHKNRARHDRRVARRNELKRIAAELGISAKQAERQGLGPQAEPGIAKGDVVRISKSADVASRYQGTKAEVLRTWPSLVDGELLAEVKAYRRKSPLVVAVADLERLSDQQAKAA